MNKAVPLSLKSSSFNTKETTFEDRLVRDFCISLHSPSPPRNQGTHTITILLRIPGKTPQTERVLQHITQHQRNEYQRMLDRCDHHRETDLMHHHTDKIDCRHTVRTECVRCDGVGAVLESSSNDEEHRNQKCLNEDSGLKEESTEDGIDQTNPDVNCLC